MPDQLQLRGGTTAEHTSFTGASKEVTVDTTKKTAVVHDGATAGGNPLMREDGANSALINGSAGAPALAFANGDGDNGIYSPGTDQVAISTNGTGRLFVNSTGDIQVGSAATLNAGIISVTANPASKNLYVAFNGTTTGADFLMGGISANANGTNIGAIDIYRGSSDDHGYISFRTKNGTTLGERVRITADGKLGLGTSSPGSYYADADNLVVASSGATGITIASSTTQYGYLCFADGTTGSDPYRGYIEYAHQNDSLALATAGTQRLFIDSSGRVGIGTTSPNTNLQIGSFANNQSLALAAGTASSCAVYFADGTGADLYRGYVQYSHVDDSLQFGTSSTERGRFDSSGRLLVGTSTTSVNTRIVAQGNSFSAGSNGRIDIDCDASTPASGDYLGVLVFGDNAQSTGAWLGAQRDGGTWSGSSKPSRLVFSTTADGASSPTERMRIASNGDIQHYRYMVAYNLGWSTTNYHYYGKDGNGSFVIYNQNNTGVYLSATGNSWNAASDERLKTDLEPIENGLQKVGQLRAITGRYINDPEDQKRSFLIAQDVQAVLPEAVDTTNPDALGLSYTDVIPLLVAALKESKERIETLEAKVAALEAS